MMTLTKGTKIAWSILGIYVAILFVMIAASGDVSIALLAAGSSLLVFGTLIWFFTGRSHSDRDCYCTRCGTVAPQKYYEAGSWAVGILLLFFFVIPGLIYIVWSHFAGYWGCPRCHAREIVPSDSPAAQRGREAQKREVMS